MIKVQISKNQLGWDEEWEETKGTESTDRPNKCLLPPEGFTKRQWEEIIKNGDVCLLARP